jgi:hypothetical protein
MYLSVFSDEELRQWVKRVSKWLSDDEKDKIASELERRGFKALDLIEGARIEAKASEGTKKAREKLQKELEQNWHMQGCVPDLSGNWEGPYELIWRSLPGGEDR